MWDENSLNRWHSLGQLLTVAERDKLLKLSHPLTKRLLNAGYMLEQEAVLPNMDREDLFGA